MNQIYPLVEDNIHRFCGMPVHVVMQDGSRYTGILTSCVNGKLMLNGHTGKGPEASLAKVTPKAKPSKKKKNSKLQKDLIALDAAHTQAYTPYYNEGGYEAGWGEGYYPWGGALLFDLALVAFLFLLI